MNREIIEKAVEEARNGESKLMISDRRDTFTIEHDDLAELELSDEHLQVKMEEGKSTVYVEYDSIHKLVVERDRSASSSHRAGFGATRG
ncbi:MAG: hypothetical protein H0V53_08310 [Rubrobacter sp.]|nr:hypothetical protein [Rubrobacter sp.]